MKIFVATLILSLMYITAAAQDKFTISGYVKDSTSNETVIGATITVKGRTKGISSNQYGFYSVTLEKGVYTISVSHIGYQSKELEIELNANKQFNFDLAPRIAVSQEVVVYSKKRDLNVKAAQMGKFELSMNQIRSVPALAGEVDP